MSELQGIARYKFHEGKLEEFKRLSTQCMEIVRTKDTGTLQYDIYFNDDQSECIVLERYRDSEALIEHLANLSPYPHHPNLTTSVRGIARVTYTTTRDAIRGKRQRSRT